MTAKEFFKEQGLNKQKLKAFSKLDMIVFAQAYHDSEMGKLTHEKQSVVTKFGDIADILSDCPDVMYIGTHNDDKTFVIKYMNGLLQTDAIVKIGDKIILNTRTKKWIIEAKNEKCNKTHINNIFSEPTFS